MTADGQRSPMAQQDESVLKKVVTVRPPPARRCSNPVHSRTRQLACLLPTALCDSAATSSAQCLRLSVAAGCCWWRCCGTVATHHPPAFPAAPALLPATQLPRAAPAHKRNQHPPRPLAHQSHSRTSLQAYSYVAIWIALSGVVILYNKYLLAVRGFPYPITLTMW